MSQYTLTVDLLVRNAAFERDMEAAGGKAEPARATLSRSTSSRAGKAAGGRFNVVPETIAIERAGVPQVVMAELYALNQKRMKELVAASRAMETQSGATTARIQDQTQTLKEGADALGDYLKTLRTQNATKSEEIRKLYMGAAANRRAEVDLKIKEAGGMDTAAPELRAELEKERALAASLIRQEAAAKAWTGLVDGAFSGIETAFKGVFEGTIKDSKSFFESLKKVFKKGLRDLGLEIVKQKWLTPLKEWSKEGLFKVLSLSDAKAGGNRSLAGAGDLRELLGGVGTAGSRIADVGGARAGGLMGFGNNIGGFAMGRSPAYAGGGFGGVGGLGSLAGFGGAGGIAEGGGSGIGAGSFGMPSSSLLTGKFAGGMPYAGAAMGLLGAYYGVTQRGSGGASSVLAGASYGALGVGVGGAIAGGLGAVGTTAGIGASAATGATGAMGALGGAAWVPVVGWVLAAAAVIDQVSGGKLFGTRYKTDSSQQTIQISDAGGLASATSDQSRQKALFGGRKRRTIDIDVGNEARSAAAGMHDVLQAYAAQLGASLKQDATALVSGTFVQSYDRKGKLTGERSTILGRSYDEDVDAFQKRLASEQAIAAVAKIDGQASRIADAWRKSADLLEDGANFLVTAAVEARSGMDLWTGIGLGALTDFVNRMQMPGEGLQATYSRLSGTARSYGEMMADVASQLMTADLSGYQTQALNIERTYRQQVKAANDYAKALGLTGARTEDLAKIEALRALQMGKLQAQIETDRKAITYGLSISDLAPRTDQEKLSDAMQALADATARGDSQAAQQAAQTALGFGRSLYASGDDYDNLYRRVTAMIDAMQAGDLALENGGSVDQLADAIEALPDHFGKALFEAAAGTGAEQKQMTAKLAESNELLRQQNTLLQELLVTTRGSASVQKRESMNLALNAR